MVKLRWIFAAALALWPGHAHDARAADPSGVWITKDGRSHISVYPCGPSYCGSVVRLAEPYEADGSPKTDTNNPDPAKRRRPLIGLRILHDMAMVEGKQRWRGTIYNPEDGDTYAGSIEIKGERLEVEGCVAIIICQSQMWTRMK